MVYVCLLYYSNVPLYLFFGLLCIQVRNFNSFVPEMVNPFMPEVTKYGYLATQDSLSKQEMINKLTK